jgi:excisionase family DNA binding protein
VTAVTYVIAAALKILHYSVMVLPKLAITMPTSTSEGEILTLKQVAEFLKVTERTIYRLAAAKKIPAFKVGGTWRFSKAEITEWIQQQSKGGKADKS